MFAGGWGDRDVVVVDGVVVGVAEGGEVGKICLSTVCPVLNMVGVCVSRWARATWVDAATVSAREDAS